jgi:hypothetical protein
MEEQIQVTGSADTDGDLPAPPPKPKPKPTRAQRRRYQRQEENARSALRRGTAKQQFHVGPRPATPACKADRKRK